MSAVMTDKQKKLVNQVAKDLDRQEGFREFAYPDVLSPLFLKYPKEKWGFKPARTILKELGIEDVEQAIRDGAPWTVGYGFTQGVNIDSRMPKLQAQRLLENKILEEDCKLHNVLSWYDGASFVTKTVLINMAFNLGLAGLLAFKNTLGYMKSKNFIQAAANMRKSLWYKQVTRRAAELAKRIETQTIEPRHAA